MKSQEVQTKQEQIAELAKRHPELSFTSLAHHIDLKWLQEAYRLTRKDGAVGIDAKTAQEYEKDLTKNLGDLLNRFKSGNYYAPAVRRAYIPKDTNEKRPIGIPTIEDKILQRAVVMLLTPLYEHDFLECSYGFRPKRGVHQALEVMWPAMMGMGEKCWILEVDIRKYFDSVRHEFMREFLSKRVNDGIIRRIIGKWLKAGVMENGVIHYDEDGTPQGGVISPLLSNIYLHEVLDKWFVNEIKVRLKGRAELIRYADDFVIVLNNENDARRIEDVLHKRFSKYGLTLHAEKTRIVQFNKPKVLSNKPDTFNFLGFTHYWGKSQRGKWIVKRKTMKKKLKLAIMKIDAYCKENRHKPLQEQWLKLCSKVQGHNGFYGITHNSRSLRTFRAMVERKWKYWLNRRSNNDQLTWARFKKILKRFPIPNARIIHSYLAKT